MRVRQFFYFTSVMAIFANPAIAADQLKFGKAPAWVIPRTIPLKDAGDDQTSPFQFLLSDQQTRVEAGRVTTFVTSAFKLQTPEGLQMGNISLPWDPARQTVTVHKLEIHRAGKVIDILAGQQFTTLRREQNLEAAALDGVLTANIQPEGLQVGDVLVLSASTEHADPVMEGHAEVGFGNWNNIPVTAAYARVLWREGTLLRFRSSAGLPEGRAAKTGGERSYEISATEVQPIIPPKGAPARFRTGRQGEATTFSSWSEVADLMRPLYETAAVIPKTGPLRDELEKIRGATADPVERAEKALDLVEHRVRYVALLMGQGGYVPASAETTWARRFGDCKAKTALLIALLKELGVSAEPVMVSAGGGDGLDQKLPMVAHFNHVIVRATFGGKNYWLDGTRTGDSKLATLETPYYHWGLPLNGDGKLVAMIPDQPKLPLSEQIIRIDASNGIYAPAPMSVEQILRGDSARQLNSAYGAMTPAQQTEVMRQYWQERFTYLTIGPVSFKYDRDAAEIRMVAKGEAKLEWDDFWLYLPGSSIAYDPTFDRPAGPMQDAPVDIGYPSLERTVTDVRFPSTFMAALRDPAKLPAAVDERVAGVHYFRKLRVDGDRLVMEARQQAMVPELPYREALAAVPRLKQLNNDEINLRVPSGYVQTKADLAGRIAEKPTTAQGFSERGAAYGASKELDLALADFEEAHRLDPANPQYLAQRAAAKVWKRDFGGAEKDINAALKIDPENEYALMNQAMIAGLTGDRAKANAILSKLIEKRPRNAPALKSRALNYSITKNFAAAEKDLVALEAINPSDPDIARLRAQFAFDMGNKKAAIEGYSKLLAANPADANLLFARANLFNETNELAKALADVSKALELEPDNADARLMRINLLRKNGDIEASLKDADFMVASKPKTTFPLVAAAKAYAAAGLHDKALKAFDQALALKAESYIYVNRSQIHPRSNRTAILADLDQALKLDPKDSDALFFKSNLFLADGKPAEAAELLAQVESLAPEHAEYYRGERAVALHKAGRMEEAAKLFGGLGKTAKTGEQFNNLCWKKATAGILLESALEDCRNALKLSPDTPAYLDSLGMVLLRLGQLNEALAAYDKALSKSEFAAALMGRAIVRARKGDAAKARADLAAARKLHARIDEQFEGYGLKFEDQKALTSR